MAKRVKRKVQKGRFRRFSKERSELAGSVDPGQQYVRVPRKPAVGFSREARDRVPTLHKVRRDEKYVARFKGVSGGLHEIHVRHDDILAAFNADQWVDLVNDSPIRCVKMFWKRSGPTYLREYNALSMTYRTSPMYGNPERAKREFDKHRVNWSDPLPMLTDE